MTTEMLAALFDRTHAEAALNLGISTSALKNVCRKLGLKKWPFHETVRQYTRIANAQKEARIGDIMRPRHCDMGFFDDVFKVRMLKCARDVCFACKLD